MLMIGFYCKQPPPVYFYFNKLGEASHKEEKVEDAAVQ